jgi:hypothetical protein
LNFSDGRSASAPSNATAGPQSKAWFDRKKGFSAANSAGEGFTAAGFADGSAPPEGGAAPVDFNGSWLCSSVIGDMEKFLTDMGLDEKLRNAACDARYGAGWQVQNISQEGDFFVVENILKVSITMKFQVGIGIQHSVDQAGKSITIHPTWALDENVPCLMVCSRSETGELIANTRRYLDGPSMMLELKSPQGMTVTRIFQRCDAIRSSENGQSTAPGSDGSAGNPADASVLEVAATAAANATAGAGAAAVAPGG